ncbi:hypothetical protein ABIE49_007606 [Bradyrhizobium sp. OAE829]
MIPTERTSTVEILPGECLSRNDAINRRHNPFPDCMHSLPRYGPRLSIDIAENESHLVMAQPTSRKMSTVNFDATHEFDLEISPPVSMPCPEKERLAAIIPLLVSNRIRFDGVPFAAMCERYHRPPCYRLTK